MIPGFINEVDASVRGGIIDPRGEPRVLEVPVLQPTGNGLTDDRSRRHGNCPRGCRDQRPRAEHKAECPHSRSTCSRHPHEPLLARSTYDVVTQVSVRERDTMTGTDEFPSNVLWQGNQRYQQR